MNMESYILAACAVGAAAYILFGKHLMPSASSLPGGQGDAITRTPGGLRNLGSTCFFNCILQALASCPKFCSWLAQSLDSCDQFPKLLHDVISSINSAEGSIVSTNSVTRLLNYIRDKGWVVENMQHDAHELFHAAMDLLHKDDHLQPPAVYELADQRDSSTEERAAVHRAWTSLQREAVRKSPILGYICSSMRCKSCLYKTPAKYDSFTSLSLLFPPGQASTHQLDDLLRYYFLTDSLSEVFCESCQKLHKHDQLVRSDFLKELSLGKSPQVLCLHIQRLGWYGYHEALKRHDKVVFPSLLDVSRYSQVYRLLSQSRLTRSLQGQSPSALHPTRSSYYTLRAVVEHLGSEASGHYVTYRRGADGSWIYASDLDVEEVSAERVHTRAPYMLFYEKTV